MTTTIHPIPPGLFCVPAALVALTGADVESVIVPALNRHMGSDDLLGTVSSVWMPVIHSVLEELGFKIRPYRRDAPAGPLRVHVATWAARSLRWPDRPVLASIGGHCLVICNGFVHDNWEPRGVLGPEHPFAKTTVIRASMVEGKQHD